MVLSPKTLAGNAGYDDTLVAPIIQPSPSPPSENNFSRHHGTTYKQAPSRGKPLHLPSSTYENCRRRPTGQTSKHRSAASRMGKATRVLTTMLLPSPFGPLRLDLGLMEAFSLQRYSLTTLAERRRRAPSGALRSRFLALRMAKSPATAIIFCHPKKE